uniref:Uncharacterized protein n=1 Tax=uncultured euryarchaeote Alv-FOS1 TaxID=337892 RepID=Q3SAB3_9EURY|nr:hypothetical protein [uncultured euryarchaeote Alv-FOS1]
MQLAINFMIYIVLPFIGLRLLMLKYPELVGGTLAMITMIYFVTLFLFSVLAVYSRYSSVPTVLSVVTTIIYMQFALSHINFRMSGADISVNMSTMMLLLYILLSLKMLVSIYSDTKQKYLSPSND